MSRPGTLAVVVIARDEEHEIGGCLRAARLTRPDEMLVLDSESTDRTRELAEEAGARVVVQPWLGFVGQRNRALELVESEWILYLDADERVTEELAADIRALVDADVGPDRRAGADPGPVAGAPGLADGAWLYRRTWFFGRPLRCIEPDRLIRLGRRRLTRWVGGHVHERMDVAGRTVDLREPLLHRPCHDLDELMAKHQRYAALVARTRLDRGQRFSWWMLLRPLPSLAKFLLVRGGWRDGRRGVLFALVYFTYSLQKVLFLMEEDARQRTEPVPFPEPGRAEV